MDTMDTTTLEPRIANPAFAVPARWMRCRR
jgi:hypothetical protein